MERENSKGNTGGVQLSVGLAFHKIIDYDRKAMRRALVKGGAVVRKEARRIVSRRAISAAGEFPGLQSGALRRAVGIVSKGSKGGWVKIGVRKTQEMAAFYPAFLFYGSQKNHLEARGNFVGAALDATRETVRSGIRDALKDSLVAR